MVSSAAVEPTDAKGVGRDLVMTDQDFQKICSLIHQHAGIALAPHKKEMVYSRLARRLRHHGLVKFKDYITLLQHSSSPEWEAFTNALTTNLTAFFREAPHFDVMSDFVRDLKRPPKIWTCASSTGEEPYSIAMALYEALGPAAARASVLATDIDTQALAKAQAGIYPLDNAKGVGEARLKRFFRKGVKSRGGFARVSDELRDLVTFRQMNLLQPSWDVKGPYDIVFCRNIMIYFDYETQTKLLDRIAQVLAPGGLFFAGHSENFSAQTQKLKLLRNTVYRKVGG